MGGQKPLACLNVVVLRLVVDKVLRSEDSESLLIIPHSFCLFSYTGVYLDGLSVDDNTMETTQIESLRALVGLFVC